jgi:hypothetical protein
MKTQNKTITLHGVELNVEFSTYGRYIPATHEDPAEYPEIEIHQVTAPGCILPLIELWDEEITNLLCDE